MQKQKGLLIAEAGEGGGGWGGEGRGEALAS